MAEQEFKFGDEFFVVGSPDIRYIVLRTMRSEGRILVTGIRIGDVRGEEWNWWAASCELVTKKLDSLITW